MSEAVISNVVLEPGTHSNRVRVRIGVSLSIFVGIKSVEKCTAGKKSTHRSRSASTQTQLLSPIKRIPLPVLPLPCSYHSRVITQRRMGIGGKELIGNLALFSFYQALVFLGPLACSPRRFPKRRLGC